MTPLVLRSWAPRGQTPVLRHRTRSHQKVSAIAAICVSPDRRRVALYFRLFPDANIRTPQVRAFLRSLLTELSAPVLLLWDRLQAHRATKIQAFVRETAQLSTEWFPSYAPELNPVEYLWACLKGHRLANLPILDVHELATIARRDVRSIQRRGELVCSFLRHSPLFLRLH